MLSDSCHDFLRTITAAAAKLQSDVEYYAEPPFSYSTEEISELRQACEAVVSSAPDRPWKPDAMLALVTAAYSTLRRYDASWLTDEDADDHRD